MVIRAGCSNFPHLRTVMQPFVHLGYWDPPLPPFFPPAGFELLTSQWKPNALTLRHSAAMVREEENEFRNKCSPNKRYHESVCSTLSYHAVQCRVSVEVLRIKVDICTSQRVDQGQHLRVYKPVAVRHNMVEEGATCILISKVWIFSRTDKISGQLWKLWKQFRQKSQYNKLNIKYTNNIVFQLLP